MKDDTKEKLTGGELNVNKILNIGETDSFLRFPDCNYLRYCDEVNEE